MVWTQVVETETEAEICLSNFDSARSRQAVESGWTGEEVNGLGRQAKPHAELAKIWISRYPNRQARQVTIRDAGLAGGESGVRKRRPKMSPTLLYRLHLVLA